MFDDFAYIQQGDMNLFVVSSSSDYKVAIVDMNSPNKDVSYVILKNMPYVDRSRSRQVEHVEGTDYVWVGKFRLSDTRCYLLYYFTQLTHRHGLCSLR